MKVFIKKYWFLIVLAFLVTILAALKIAVRNIPPSTEPPVILPSPAPEILLPTPTLIIYPPLTSVSDSSPWSKTWPTQAIISKDNPQLIMTKEFYPQDRRGYLEYVRKYGSPDSVLYGPDASAGFYLFVFLKKGVAVLASPQTEVVLEVWRFPPVNLNLFIESFGDGLSLKPPDQF